MTKTDKLTVGLIDDRYIESLMLDDHKHYDLRYWSNLSEMTVDEINKCDQVLIDFYFEGITAEPCAIAVERCKDAGVPCAIRTGAPNDQEVIGVATEAKIPVIPKGSYNEAMPILRNGDGVVRVVGWIPEQES